MQTAASIGRLNFLRTKFRQTSLYMMIMDSAKTRADKTRRQIGMIVSSLESMRKLYWLLKKKSENENQLIQDQILLATVVIDAPPQRRGVSLEPGSEAVLEAQGALPSSQIHWTINWKELQTIHLGIVAFSKVCREQQIINLLIWPDNSTAIFDLRRLRATDTLTPAVKEICRAYQHLNMKILTKYFPGKNNIIVDALSRLCRQGDYQLHQMNLDQM
ncbi:MAG: hypothetical protein EZS28_010776 [Streblomastix strix]|uniref:Reverse transcriptase RNase H-like domain-containing protein n=1 Tax=Streblomastix strix TaxID=222440 RepID=A0A5J4WGN5_9EUKA|nr:MAG: hypothetical protein EZS28_010776 [Streblomastix strix]